MVVAEPRRARKGWYFVAARVLTAGLAVVLSYDITASPTVVSVTFALVLAAQHAVRWAMRSRLAEVPFQQAAVWITLAGQALLPLVYTCEAGGPRVAGAGPRRRPLGGAAGTALLLVSAVVARRLFRPGAPCYFAVYAALFGVLALGQLFTFGGTFLSSAVLSHTGTAIDCAGCGAACGRCRHRATPADAGRQRPDGPRRMVTNRTLARGRRALALAGDRWLLCRTGLVVSPLAAELGER